PLLVRPGPRPDAAPPEVRRAHARAAPRHDPEQRGRLRGPAELVPLVAAAEVEHARGAAHAEVLDDGEREEEIRRVTRELVVVRAHPVEEAARVEEVEPG